MDGQVEFYDHFGKLHRQSILNCAEPELWTTDFDEKGRVYQEMKERLKFQQQFINKYFEKVYTVLDIGCGFGRQAAWLAKNGFRVVGIDSSPVFIELVKQIFEKRGYEGEFNINSLKELSSTSKFKQVLLLDVLEHFPPSVRLASVEKISELMESEGFLFISLPRVKDRISSWVNNSIVKNLKYRFGFFSAGEEHPYPIPTKKQVLKLFSRAFDCREFLSSAPTDYYIFQKR